MINQKLLNIQANLKAPKNLYNSFGKYNYRNAEGIQEAVKPYLLENKCSLTLSDTIENIGDRYYIKSTATITDVEKGDTISVTAFAHEPSDKKGMDASQITGATSSYARKYALNGLFLLDDTKDADTDESKIEADARAKKEADKKANEKLAEDTAKQPISAGELETLKKRINGDSKLADKICKLYKVEKLEDLSGYKFANIMQHWGEIVGN